MTFEELAKRLRDRDIELYKGYEKSHLYKTVDGRIALNSERALEALTAVVVICEALGNKEVPSI